MSGEDTQLGDFIKGRHHFLQTYCKEHGLDYDATWEKVKTECLRLAARPDRQAFLEERVFSGVMLASTMFPDWLDKVLLEALTIVLKGPGAPMTTTSSRHPCIAFEAGRSNAHRQADTVFKLYFSGKQPEEWLKVQFPTINRKCYGDEFVKRMSVEEAGPKHFRVVIDNRGVGKASQTDCATGIGYLYGALERLGAHDPVVTHDRCGSAPGSLDKTCVFDVTWK